MNIIRDAVAGMVPAVGNTCLRIEGMAPTIRIVSNPLSTIVLAALGGSPNEAFVYGLVGTKVGSLKTQKTLFLM